MRSAAGFTLIELLVVMSIMAVLAAWVAPNFRESVNHNQLKSTGGDFYNMLRFARASAVRAAQPVAVGALDKDGKLAGDSVGDWPNGLLVWREPEGDVLTFDVDTDTTDEEIRRSVFDIEDLKFTVTPDTEVIAFDGAGYSTLGKVVITICSKRGNKKGREITVLPSGLTAFTIKTDC